LATGGRENTKNGMKKRRGKNRIEGRKRSVPLRVTGIEIGHNREVRKGEGICVGGGEIRLVERKLPGVR